MKADFGGLSSPTVVKCSQRVWVTQGSPHRASLPSTFSDGWGSFPHSEPGQMPARDYWNPMGLDSFRTCPPVSSDTSGLDSYEGSNILFGWRKSPLPIITFPFRNVIRIFTQVDEIHHLFQSACYSWTSPMRSPNVKQDFTLQGGGKGEVDFTAWHP